MVEMVLFEGISFLCKVNSRFLLDHFQLQDVIDVSPDRSIAKGRLRCFMQAGTHISQKKLPYLAQQWWEHGIYENEYIRDPKTGIWKIYRMNYRPQYHADYESGWAHTKPNYLPFPTKTYPEDPAGPDELVEDADLHLWPDTDVVPFHYAHPVTGEKLTAEEMSAPEKSAK
jgi:SnoaL-like domain